MSTLRERMIEDMELRGFSLSPKPAMLHPYQLPSQPDSRSVPWTSPAKQIPNVLAERGAVKPRFADRPTRPLRSLIR